MTHQDEQQEKSNCLGRGSNNCWPDIDQSASVEDAIEKDI